MAEPRWLSITLLEIIHEEQIAEHGGLLGLRDRGGLEAATARPRQLFAYGEPTMVDLAAAYASALVRNHPCVDGNKRTGFLAAYTFLGVNGLRMIASEPDAAAATLALAAGEMTEADYAAWLSANVEER